MHRYSRQFVLPEIGKRGQEKIALARVAIVGIGALGSVSAQLCARAGIGFIKLIDRDVVEWSNLQRQVLFTEQDAHDGLAKASAAKRHLELINSEIQIESVVEDLNSGNIFERLHGIDVILDGTDNFETRYLLNEYAVKNRVSYIYGGAIETRGMVYAVLPDGRPCLKCIFPESEGAQRSQTCDRSGILASAAHVVASIQFTQLVQVLVGEKASLPAELISFDVWKTDFKKISSESLAVSRCSGCEEKEFPYLEGKNGMQLLKLCGRNAVQIQSSGAWELDWGRLAKEWKGETAVQVGVDFARVTVPDYEFMLFKNGRVIVKGTEDPVQAKSIYSRWMGC